MASRRWTFACVLVVLAGCKREDEGPILTTPPPTPAAQVARATAAPSVTALTDPPPRQESTLPVAPAIAAPPSAASAHHDALPVCNSKGDPLEAARRYYDGAQFEEALACAAQATAFYPDLPQSHSERGAALSAVARFEEAQVAYARALALDPDYPDALLGAAHLFAVSLASSRERDELASVYAEKGLANARAHKDPKLLVQFALVSAMAFNDLGRSAEAQARAEEVLRRDRGNKEAQYERAVALFEQCRFADARTAFTGLLSDRDRGPHANHHLGLILEREGKLEAAQQHFAHATRASPEDFPEPVLLSPADFKAEVDRAIAQLPEDMKRDLVGVPIETEDLPEEEDLVGGEPPLSPTILGLFRGPPLGERCEPEIGEPCRSVALYRRNLARAVLTHKELLEQIRITLLHEVGHLRGEDDHELAARGLE